MSRKKVDIVLFRLYGIPTPKALNLPVHEYREKEHRHQGQLVIPNGQTYRTGQVLTDLHRLGYRLSDPNVRFVPRAGSDKTVQVTYLPYVLDEGDGQLVATSDESLVAVEDWIRKLFRAAWKGVQAHDNPLADGRRMLSLELTGSTGCPSRPTGRGQREYLYPPLPLIHHLFYQVEPAVS